MAEQANFKRINFFEGFFTTDEDWNAAEAYHLEKRRLHNCVLHTPGVVPVEAGGLKLTARGRGDLSFEVAPGYGIDGRGNELVLRDPAVKVIEADKLKLPQTVYVAIKYFEEPTDFIAYKENPRVKGHRRIEEKVKIEVLEREMVDTIEKDFPQIAARKGFAEYKKALEALTKVVRDRPRDADGCMGIARFLSASNQALTPVVKEKLTPSAKKEVKGEQISWKDVVIRSKDFPEELNIDGSNFVRVDHLQLVNDESEKEHKFRIEGQQDMWKSRQTFTYPDKEPVSDSGAAYIGGEAKWQVQNLKPGKDLIVIKRFDAILGEQICDISVDGKKVGQWKVTEADRKHRWRNHYFLVPGTFVTNDSLEMSAKAVSAERDINMFQLWFYQPA